MRVIRFTKSRVGKMKSRVGKLKKFRHLARNFLYKPCPPWPETVLVDEVNFCRFTRHQRRALYVVTKQKVLR